MFLLSHGTSPWHAATAGAGELHGPQKSQAVRQSRQAARLCLANTPLMSFQKTRGKEGARLQIICFSFLLAKKKRKKFFLPNETWGLGKVNYFTNLVHGSQKRPRPALQEHRGNACELQMGCPLGRTCPSWDQSDLGTQSFHYTPNSSLETPVGRLFSRRVGRETHISSCTSTGVGLCGTPGLGLSKLAAISLPGATMFTFSI